LGALPSATMLVISPCSLIRLMTSNEPKMPAKTKAQQSTGRPQVTTAGFSSLESSNSSKMPVGAGLRRLVSVPRRLSNVRSSFCDGIEFSFLTRERKKNQNYACMSCFF
jgi:BRCT domain type II-containing protein